MGSDSAPIRSRRMAVKKKPAKRAAAPVVEFIVRRKALRRFDKLKQATKDLPEVKLSWDRRMSERRISPKGADGDKRQTERRQKPPFTWEVADFVVVEKSTPRAARTQTRRKRP